MPKRKYDLAFKQKAVQNALTSSNRAAARAFGVDEKRIREWRTQLPKFDEMKQDIGAGPSNKRCRIKGGGRKPLLPEIEQCVADWVVQQRLGYRRVTRHGIALKAKELASSQGQPTFKASRGWVDKFIRRNDFCIRRKTTTGQRLPPELTDKVCKFVLFCKKQRARYQFSPGAIGNMDETAIWSDMPGNNSIDQVGAKTVPVLTTGHEKNRVTVCLGALADGRKLQPLMVFKGKRLPAELKDVRGIVIEMSSNGWMQAPTTLAWIDKCWGKMAFTKRMLIWDSFRNHITDESKERLKETNTIMGVIPGGCTKLLQPADVSWNAPFKAAYTVLYEQWLQQPARATDLTPAGNPRAPSRLTMVNWVKEAWKQLSPDVIVRSFEACGITSADPDRIHCTKVGGIAEAARDAIMNDWPVQEADGSSSEEDTDATSETDSADDIDV